MKEVDMDKPIKQPMTMLQASRAARERLVHDIDKALTDKEFIQRTGDIKLEAVKEMRHRAQSGFYGDFTSPIATPITRLVRDATALGLTEVATKARDGEYDG